MGREPGGSGARRQLRPPDKNYQIAFAQAGQIWGAASTAPGNPRLWLGNPGPGIPPLTSARTDLIYGVRLFPRRVSALAVASKRRDHLRCPNVGRLSPPDGGVPSNRIQRSTDPKGVSLALQCLRKHHALRFRVALQQ